MAVNTNAVFKSKIHCPKGLTTFLRRDIWNLRSVKYVGWRINPMTFHILFNKMNYFYTRKLKSNISLRLIISDMHTTKKWEKCWHKPCMVQKCLESESRKYPQTQMLMKNALGTNLTFDLFRCKWHLAKAIFIHEILA